MAQVELHGVSKVYAPDTLALDAVDLQIQDREFVALVGPSGCGKSTLLRLIAGLEEVTSGEIRIDGKRMNSVPPKDRDVAMVFQNYALYPHMTVRENMAFALTLRRHPKDWVTRRVQEAAEILEVEHLLDRMPDTLSGGQRQRVAVGRAMVRKPKVFLLDEPLSNLDATLRVQMRAQLARLHSRLQATMIYVTHDQVEAMTMGNRIAVLREGLIQQVDTPMNLYNTPANRFVAGFIGSPAMNVLRGTLLPRGGLRFQHAQFHLPILQPGTTLGNYVNREVLWGIRPEHVLLAENTAGTAAPDGIEAVVDVVEPMGHETFLHLRVGEDTLTVRTSPRQSARVGDTVSVRFDPRHSLLFDMKTERTIASGVGVCDPSETKAARTGLIPLDNDPSH